MAGTRGQSDVLGTVLLLGFGLATVSTLVVIGGSGLVDIQDEASFERAEAEMTQLDSRAGQVALGESPAQVVQMPSDQSGRVTVSEAGQVWLVTDEGDEILNESIGRVTYRRDDEVVSYEGGGVWRGTGRGTRVVAPPELHYRGGTLTLPLVRIVAGDGDPPPGEIRVESGASRYDLGPGHFEDTQVTLVVQSEHYRGWATYLENRAQGSVAELDHAANVAAVDLGHFTIGGDFETGLVAQGDIYADHPGTTTNTEVRATGTAHGDFDGTTEGAAIELEPLDDGIERLVNQSESEDPHVNLNTTGSLDAGTYYSDSVHLDGDTLTVDVTDGNVTVFLDGHLGLEGGGRIEVVGDDTGNALKVFSTGDFALTTGSSAVTTIDDASGFQLYGTSEMHFGVGQGDFTGAVYAPRESPASGDNEALQMLNANSVNCANDVDVCLGTGSPTIEGAIIAGPMEVAQSTTFDYDDRLATTEPALPPDADLPPPLTFLHVSVNELRISGPELWERNVSTVNVSEYVGD